MGIHRACREAQIVGVDILPRPHYPFNFIQMDALQYEILREKWDFIWASPPCHRWVTGAHDRQRHPDCLHPMMRVLRHQPIPYVIENVPNAPHRHDLMLCGEMFGLRTIRHRWFECSFAVVQPPHPKHRGLCFKHKGKVDLTAYYFTVAGKQSSKYDTMGAWKAALNVTWDVTREELVQMVPPPYSKYVFQQFLQHRPRVSLEQFIKAA